MVKFNLLKAGCYDYESRLYYVVQRLLVFLSGGQASLLNRFSHKSDRDEGANFLVSCLGECKG